MIKKLIENRLKQRSTVDGVLMVAAGGAMIIVPINLIAYALIAYGIYTIARQD